MAYPEGQGNPNYGWKTFKETNYMVPNQGVVFSTLVVLLDCTNDVQILGDCTIASYNAGATFATLPDTMWPDTIEKIPVVVKDTQGETIEILTINLDGEISLSHSHSMCKVFLSAINFNISERWYSRG